MGQNCSVFVDPSGYTERHLQSYEFRHNLNPFNNPTPSNKWNTARLWGHYREGSGKGVRLGDIGLAKQFENHPSVRREMDSFINESMGLLAERCVHNHKSKGDTNVTEFSELFSVGDSTFFRNFYYREGQAQFLFQIRDEFKDPFDGALNPMGMTEVGVPYKIDHDFWIKFDYAPVTQ